MDPDTIPGLHPRADAENNSHAERRDPDAAAPSNLIQELLFRFYQLFSVVWSDGFFFAVKAGVISVLVAVPSFTPASAAFFYDNRGLWVLIMAQLTLGRHVGDTVMAWAGRGKGSLAGCLVGLLVWTIGAGGGGRGSPIGMGAATAVAFPMLMLVRLFYPCPPLTKIIFSASPSL